MIWARIFGVLLLVGMLVLGGDLLMQRFPDSVPAVALRTKTMAQRLEWMQALQQEILKTHDQFDREDSK